MQCSVRHVCLENGVVLSDDVDHAIDGVCTDLKWWTSRAARHTGRDAPAVSASRCSGDHFVSRAIPISTRYTSQNAAHGLTCVWKERRDTGSCRSMDTTSRVTFCSRATTQTDAMALLFVCQQELIWRCSHFWKLQKCLTYIRTRRSARLSVSHCCIPLQVGNQKWGKCCTTGGGVLTWTRCHGSATGLAGAKDSWMRIALGLESPAGMGCSRLSCCAKA